MGKQYEIPLGAQHISLLEPLHFKFTTENEKIVDTVANVYYVHRGIEQACCSKFKFRQVSFVVGRVCGLCSVSHTTAYSQVAEKLIKIEVPRRAKYLRMLVIELDRIHSHLLCLSHVAENSGFEALFMKTMQYREFAMELLEAVCGNRIQYDFSIVGGVARDLKPEVGKMILERLKIFKPQLDELVDIYQNNWTLSLKNKGVGLITKEDALRLNVVGPFARATGLAADVRNEYDDLLPWKEVGFEMVLDKAGDVHARNMVRLRELYVSMRIIENIINGLPESALVTETKTFPDGEAVARLEAPRGELFYYAKGNKTQILERLKIKAPTFSNIPAMVEAFKGNEYGSAPAIIASYDPCLSCTSR
ncbi:proton-conducting membrane transporter [Ginsengibacter hankyongi]|uniref:Proton-conducting membrane transporter n=1 Tax=Ginsengibacter hankyongi TaxID=2607284 RepID=A0A5J5IIQ6_9BACT|nr:nickel-dependent hydrogenase large subunit [Ginsengibacter hankyongi]KAA9040925.1 proton-conducting membrane transporter [Ginsengibacter hankyongi]